MGIKELKKLCSTAVYDKTSTFFIGITVGERCFGLKHTILDYSEHLGMICLDCFVSIRNVFYGGVPILVLYS